MAEQVWPWARIERDYLAGKYKSLREISQKEGMSYRMVQRRSVVYKWGKKRKQTIQRAEDILMEGIAKESADEAMKARNQILKISNILINQGLQKFYDEEGNLKKNTIPTAQTAITALSAGVRMKMDLYGLKEKEDSDNGSNIYQIFQQQNNSSTINFQGVSDDELERIIRYGRQRLGIADGRRGGGSNKKKGSKK